MIDMLFQAMQNPTVLAVLVIQFLLGFALGYITVKVIKYIIAFIAILVIGVILNVWSLSFSLEDLAPKLGEYGAQAKEAILNLMSMLGLLIAGPIIVGFMVGALIAWLRR
ncbi:MAG: hypothetical protein QW056_02625 [Candidatus Bathyarchaeia archaeon]